MKAKHWTLGFVAAGLVLGCGQPHVDAEGCEHLKEGPPAAVTATAGTAGAPAIKADHQRYDAALVDVTGGKGGHVSYASAEAAHYVFFLDADVPVKFLDSSSNEVVPEESATSSAGCAEIKGRHAVPLGVGTYFLSLGPTSQTSVGIVVEEEGGH